MSDKPLVLIVDDDDGIRESLELCMEAFGYPSIAFSDARTPLETLRTLKKPCIILLDLMMPGMDGRAFLDQYAMFGLDALHAVIVMSASIEKFAHSAMRERVGKPFDLDALEAMLGRLAGELYPIGAGKVSV